jgi:chemotaxis protein methyltransferase CheR
MLDDGVFATLRDLVYRESGIVITDQKRPLLANRLAKRLKALNLSSDAEYLQVIETDRDGAELVHLLDAVSTNVTYFFREPQHFEFLRAELAKLGEQEPNREVKIWCAAASSGDEPYTIAMTAEDMMPGNWRLLGTDICMPVLQRAQAGLYKETDLEKVPDVLRRKYFTKVKMPDNDYAQVSPTLMSKVLFKRLNLVQFPYSLKGNFDFIFCRNVMIYFDKPTRQKIVEQFERLLRPGGYLILSLSESLLGITSSLQKQPCSVYKKV